MVSKDIFPQKNSRISHQNFEQRKGSYDDDANIVRVTEVDIVQILDIFKVIKGSTTMILAP